MAQPISDNFQNNSNKPLDNKYGPYASIEIALSTIPIAYRHVGLTIGILNRSKVVDYFWEEGTDNANLVKKLNSSPSTPPSPEGIEWVSPPGAPTVNNYDLTETDSIIKVDGVNHNVPSSIITFGVAGGGLHRIDAVVVDLTSFTYYLIEGDEVDDDSTAASPTISNNYFFVRYVTVTDGIITPIAPTYVQAISVNNTVIYPDSKGIIAIPSYKPLIVAVDSVAEMNAIPLADRTRGMIAYVVNGPLYNQGRYELSPTNVFQSVANFGLNNTVWGYANFVAGSENTTSNNYASAIGDSNIASGIASMAAGYLNEASGDYSNVQNSDNIASNDSSSASGKSTQSGGIASWSGGAGSGAGRLKVVGDYSFIHSQSTIADKGVFANNAFIIGGKNNKLEATAARSGILGGEDITGTLPDTIYTPNILNTGKVNSIGGLQENGLDLEDKYAPIGSGGVAANVRQVLTYAATTVMDYLDGNLGSITITGDVIFDIQNTVDGDTGIIFVRQGGAGGFDATVSGAIPTGFGLAQGVGELTVLGFINEGGTLVWDYRQYGVVVEPEDPDIIPAAPNVVADDDADTLDFTHALGDSEIEVNENGAGYVDMTALAGWNATTGKIDVGDVARASGYWIARVKAASGRTVSATVSSPAFTVYVAPPVGSMFDSIEWYTAHRVGDNTVTVVDGADTRITELGDLVNVHPVFDLTEYGATGTAPRLITSGINGYPALEISGGTQIITSSNYNSISAAILKPITRVVVFKLPTVDASYKYIVSSGGGQYDLAHLGTGNKFFIYNGSGAWIESISTVQANKVYVAFMEFKADNTARLFLNDPTTPEASGALGTHGEPGSFNPFAAVALGDVQGLSANALFTIHGIYNGLFSDADRIALMNELVAKYDEV